jgi:hypothetical protein
MEIVYRHGGSTFRDGLRSNHKSHPPAAGQDDRCAGISSRARPLAPGVYRSGSGESGLTPPAGLLVREGNNWVTRQRAGTKLSDDDLGPNFLTLMRGVPRENNTPPEARHWTAIWLAPIFEGASPRGDFRFQVVLTRRDGTVSQEFESCPFVVNLSPAQRAVAIPSGEDGISARN